MLSRLWLVISSLATKSAGRAGRRGAAEDVDSSKCLHYLG
jgi:hypothetical protein